MLWMTPLCTRGVASCRFCGFPVAAGISVYQEPEPAYGGGVDLVERAVALLGPVHVVTDPILTGLAGILQRGIINAAGLLRHRNPCSCNCEKERKNGQFYPANRAAFNSSRGTSYNTHYVSRISA